MRTSTLEQLKRHLRLGRVYRREDLLPWSRSVDRHLKQLTLDGTLQKLRTGLYYSPRNLKFGEAPADVARIGQGILENRPFYGYLTECIQPTGTRDDSAVQQTGRLQPEAAPDISSRQSTGHFRAPHELEKKPERWTRESCHAQFLSTASIPRRKVSEDVAACHLILSEWQIFNARYALNTAVIRRMAVQFPKLYTIWHYSNRHTVAGPVPLG